jgi:hypothetical protein
MVGNIVVTKDQVAFAVGVVAVLIAHWPMAWLTGLLRVGSGLRRYRFQSEVGVPPSIVGSFERLMAFGLTVFDFDFAATLLIAWIGAKLAASWQRFPVNDDESGRRVRAGTMVALIAGIVSVAFAAGMGVLARDAICRQSSAFLHCTMPGP